MKYNRYPEQYFLANCGVFLKTPTASILVDGFCEETEFFEGLSSDTFDAMCNGDPPFDEIDYILFTHQHADHFDATRLFLYLQSRPIKGLFLPVSEPEALTELYAFLKEKNLPAMLPEGKNGARLECQIPDGRIRAIPVDHSGPEYQQVNHYALLVELMGRRYYFSGDSIFTDDSQRNAIAAEPVDYAFFNPYHLNHPNGRAIISAVQAACTSIYHLPPANKDFFRILSQAIKDAATYGDRIKHLRLLKKKGLFEFL